MNPRSAPRSLRHLQRQPRRRRLGGVCAGIAVYTGLDLTLVRFLFVLSLFISFGLAFWAYVALWFLLPAAEDTPMPEVSWNLARQLRKIDRKLAKLHRKHDPQVADLAQEAFDAIKLLAPEFERPGAAAVHPLAEAALVRFPALLDRLIAQPAGSFGSGREAAALLLEPLNELAEQFREAALAGLAEEWRGRYGAGGQGAGEFGAFRELLEPLAARLRDHAGPETREALAGIEEKLGFLLERLEGSDELLDLRPFEVRKIAFEYLPDALKQYLQLPAGMARSEPLGSGRTAEESLNDQLRLLDTTLHDLARSLFEKDATGLLVHGRFLKEKFAEQPFRLEDRAGREL
jgi:phage shock protein PspC (stress-responsive transcriptional regulator)